MRMIVCDECDGTGEAYYYNGSDVDSDTCLACNGTGRVEDQRPNCPDCDGTGEIIPAHGLDLYRCARCAGTGKA
jgi:DnaJ-class molecular chaperone